MESKDEFTMAHILPGARDVINWWSGFNLANLRDYMGECDMKIDYDRLLNELIRETEKLIQKANYYVAEKTEKKESEEAKKWAHRSMICSFALLNLKDREHAKLLLKMAMEENKEKKPAKPAS